MMKQVLIDLAKSIVNKPECVEVTESVNGDTVYLKLKVDESDLGKVNKRVIVDILETDEE